MLAIVAPGQGSQVPGFLTPWLELPYFEDRMRWLGTVAGIDLVAHGTTSDEDTIRDTAIAQPLIVSAGMISLLSLFPHPGEAFAKVGIGAGHSVGEITAAAASHVISAEQAMVFVRERGNAMAAAAAITATSMSAVLGGERDDVIATLESFGLTAANENGGGQIVAAGTIEQLQQLADNPPAGSRIRSLSVAGAFHTQHMAPAVSVLAQHAKAISTHDSRIQILSNADGTVMHSGREVLKRLVTQVSNPVRWDLCMQTMLDLGVTALIELPPAGTLVGLAKRAMPVVETLALKTPDDIPAALDLVARHASSREMSESPTWRLIVAPFKGTIEFNVSEEPGTVLDGHTQVATIRTLRDEYPVLAPHGGTIVEWLVTDGDPVNPGQSLLRLHPKAGS
ncbi:MAG: acyltransferase domain-containing protein [Actinobacteria bacterium]|uniref:[acyl-carrier-protein] S-malonyltransferase n=1 Tax=freshwater metagenome TaxID=449393 RepID=A0A6J5YKU8_9ZZZZ|nr:acyltransferase domain-containing protein [Actinomycetota bacterium]